MRIFSIVLGVLAAGSAAQAQVVSAHADKVSVTLYHDQTIATSQILHPDQNAWVRDEGFAFITETRTVDLPAGATEIRFEGVSSTMVPQTASIEGLPAQSVERNFDYDLLSPGSLLAKSLGQSVRLVRTNPKTGKLEEDTAIVRSGPDGAVFEIDGKFEALRCSGLPEKLVFEHVPEGLADTPTLSLKTRGGTPGHYTIKLSYIATGLNWSADYVARISNDTNTLDLSGWLTLANFSATSFPDAPVDVVAGHLNTTGSDEPVRAAPRVLATNCWPTNIDWARHHGPTNLVAEAPAPMSGLMGFAGAAKERDETVVVTGSRIVAQQLGDYKLYALPEPTTVAAQQTKQIQFVEQTSVKFERIYQYTISGYERPEDLPAHASVIVRLQNKSEQGLGIPLPAGSVSVFQSSKEGAAVFAGQNTISDITTGLPVEVEIGRALDVRVEPRLAKSVTSGKGATKMQTDDWEIAIENDKPNPVTFEYRQNLYNGAARIRSESIPHEARFGRSVWTLLLAKGQRVYLRYAIEHPA